MWSLKSVFQYNVHNRDQFIADMAKQVAPGALVLDAGAGPCRYKPLFRHCAYKSQDFAKYEGDNHVYGQLDYIGDITNIPVSDGYFDCVLCTEVLEHVPEPERAIREFARILRPGGKLILTAPLMSGIHMAPYHFFGGFTPHWYQTVLPLHGFLVERCTPNGGFFKLYGQESQRFLFMLTPQSSLGKVVFFPFKVALGIWFKFIMPVSCHLLDALDQKKEFTAGYFVVATHK